jgi:hypothetical protein
MIRSILVGALNHISEQEQGFDHSFWREIYVTYRCENGTYKTKYLAEIDFRTDIVNDHDLIRIFEYVIRCQETRRDRFPIHG